MNLHRLLYSSRSALDGSEEACESEMNEILRVSQRNNARAGLSGALLFTHTHFVQVLEGPADAIEPAFERICGDLRHYKVALIDSAPAEERMFGSWSMERVDAGPAIASLPPEIIAGTACVHAAEATVQLMRRLLRATETAPRRAA